MEVTPLEKARKSETGLSVRCLADVIAEPINWLWEGHFAKGKVSLIAGDPGLGKSQLSTFLASVITTGGSWPVDRKVCQQGSVVFLSAEDDAADTIRPRLEAAGADLRKCHILEAVKETSAKGKAIERCFSLKADLVPLGELLKQLGDVALVVIDPITAYLGGTDSYKNADVRSLLAPLSKLASEYKVAIIGISHFNKGECQKALQKVSGSLAFVAASRAAYAVLKDKNDPDRRLFLPIKNNIGNDKLGFAFRIESVTLPSGIKTSKIVFEPEAVTEQADEVLADQATDEERSELEGAKDFLQELCIIGPTAKQVYVRAEEAGYSKATIRRAQKALNIKPSKDGKSGPWVWRLPEDAQSFEDVHQKNMSTFGTFEHLPKDYDQSGETNVLNGHTYDT